MDDIMNELFDEPKPSQSLSDQAATYGAALGGPSPAAGAQLRYRSPLLF